MRAFVGLREIMAAHKDLARKLEELEKKYDKQFSVVEAIKQLMTPPEPPPKRRIGFGVVGTESCLQRKEEAVMPIPEHAVRAIRELPLAPAAAGAIRLDSRRGILYIRSMSHHAIPRLPANGIGVFGPPQSNQSARQTRGVVTARVKETQPPKLLDRVRLSIRARHYSKRTEESYVHWIDLALKEHVSSSTQNQVLSAVAVPVSLCSWPRSWRAW